MGVVVDGVLSRGMPYFSYTDYRAPDISIMLNWTTKHSRKPIVIVIRWKLSLCHRRGLCGSESTDTRILNSCTRGLVITEYTTTWALSPVWTFFGRGNSPACQKSKPTFLVRPTHGSFTIPTELSCLTPHSMITLQGVMHNRYFRFVQDSST